MGFTHLSKFRLATCPLTGGKKPGGERIPHPHHLLFNGKARNQNEGHLTPPVLLTPIRGENMD